MRSLLLFPLALLLNVNLLFFDDLPVPSLNPYLGTILLDLYVEHPIWHWLLFSTLVFIVAILINRMVIINRLSNTITLFPGLFYVVLASSLPSFGGLTSVSFSVLFLILLLSNLMYINARIGATGKLFNVGVYLGLMILMFSPTVVYFFLVFLAINVLSTIKQNVILNVINGMLLPIYFALVYILLFDEDMIENITLSSQFGIENIRFPSTLMEWISVSFVALLLLFSLFAYNHAISKKSIQSIRKIQVLMYVAFAGLLTYFISGVESYHFLIFTLPSIGYFLSESILRLKKETNAELIFILIMIFSILISFL